MVFIPGRVPLASSRNRVVFFSVLLCIFRVLLYFFCVLLCSSYLCFALTCLHAHGLLLRSGRCCRTDTSIMKRSLRVATLSTAMRMGQRIRFLSFRLRRFKLRVHSVSPADQNCNHWHLSMLRVVADQGCLGRFRGSSRRRRRMRWGL